MNPDDRPTVAEPHRMNKQVLMLVIGLLIGVFLGVTFKEFILLGVAALLQNVLMRGR